MPTHPHQPHAPRVAIVTGGGTGIGRATGLALAEAGHRVVVTGRRAEPLEAVAGEHPGVHPFRADAGDPLSARALTEHVEERFGRLDLLVNNAGRFSAAPFAEVDDELLVGLFRTNVFGPLHLFRAALPLLERTGGAVVNVSSTLAVKAVPGPGVYGASKAALEQLTRSWALEAAPRGVRVNAVAPGPTETGILHTSGLDAAAVRTIQEGERRAVPLGRRGTPEEVARWILHLAAPGEAWTTGQVLRVDGGLSVA